MTITLADLPANSPNLYTAELNGETVGIGTAEEFRALHADGIFDMSDPLEFKLAQGE